MSRSSLLLLPLAALCAAAAPAKHQTDSAAPAGKSVSIPFVQFDGIYDFRPDGDRAVYLQDRRRKWYHATILGPCLGLSFATRIGVKTSGSTSLDRYGALLVDGQECRLDELTTSGPPKRAKTPKKRR